MRWAALMVAMLVTALVPLASADHVQSEQGKSVAFDHKTGNEWWVEVVLGGASSGSVARVEAMDTGGPWVQLEKKSWGAYAASFRIEPGNDVRFRASWSDGTVIMSCWFSHPGGVEKCGTPPPPSGGPTFDHTGGNEWWVQVKVTGAPTRVQAMDTNGPWTELQFKSWGDWAASFRIEPGHDVRFRAMTDGTWHESCWFTHPGGRTPTGGQTCGATGGEPPPPPPGDFDAQFRPKAGNEWWVEVFVDANEPLAGVAARDDGGPWVALEKKSWGAWARSFHVQDGSIVEFRARSTSGDTDVSGKYRWPDATPVGEEPPPPPGVDIAFAPKAGNEWWVETLVVRNGPVTGVEARSNGGAWHKLTLRDWGAWAGSFHVPAGSTVEFRATTGDGTDVSDGFAWPGATFVGGDGSWPEEGSYVRYTTSGSDPAPSSSHGTETLVFHDGSWWSWSETETTFESDPEPLHTTRFCDDAALPSGPTGVQVNDRVDVQVGTCFNGSYDVIVRRADTHATNQEGDAVTMQTWYAQRTDPCNCLEWIAEWDQGMGLLAFAHQSGRGSAILDLEDTDAPIQTG